MDSQSCRFWADGWAGDGASVVPHQGAAKEASCGFDSCTPTEHSTQISRSEGRNYSGGGWAVRTTTNAADANENHVDARNMRPGTCRTHSEGPVLLPITLSRLPSELDPERQA